MAIGAGIYPAETLVDWGLLSRVIAADRLEEEGRRFAALLGTGPTIAHQATKRILRAWRSGGVSAADQVMQSEGPRVMLSQDLQRGAASLISSGPGHATFTNQ
jgi:enoyl-CoA hydratase